MANHFSENRKRIQDALYDLEFVIPIEESECIITEEKNKKESSNKNVLLTELSIENIPYKSETSYVNAWEVDLEIEKSIFSAPAHFKTVERAILFYTPTSLYVLMIEMKNSLQPYKEGGIKSIEGKFKATISRLSVLLPIHIYTDSLYEDIEIKYLGLVAYNHDKVSSNLVQDEELAREEICKILLGNQPSMFLTDYFGHSHDLKIHFCQNESVSESMEIDLNTLFENDWEFPNACYTELKCPKL